MPLLLIVLAGAEADAHATTSHHAVTVVLEEIGYGVLGGVAAGGLAAAIVLVAGRRGLIADSWLRVIPVASAALAYGIADPLGGSGFIAAFVAGLCFGPLVGKQALSIAGFNEELGELLNGVTFVAFGAVLLGPALGRMTWDVRPLCRVEPDGGTDRAGGVRAAGERRPTTDPSASSAGSARVAWPRSCSPFSSSRRRSSPTPTRSLPAAYVTVGLSVLLHGLSAAPLAQRYARWYETHPRDLMESDPVGDQRPRGPVAPVATSEAVDR